jgi:hypothetical protein
MVRHAAATGRGDRPRALYRRFIDLVTACGPFSYSVATTAIRPKGTRRGFAGAEPTACSLDGYLDLQRPGAGSPGHARVAVPGVATPG